MTIGAKIAVATGLTLTLILAVGGLSLYVTVRLGASQRYATETGRWVEHTYQVLAQLREVLALLTDAESGERGYLLLGEESYAQRFADARDRAPRALDELRDLTRDNPAQQRRLRDLGPLVRERFQFMQEVIDLRRRKDGGPEAAVEKIRTGRGRQLLGDIRGIIGAMTDEENALLGTRVAEAEVRDTEAQAAGRLSLLTTAGATVLAALVAAGAGLLITRSVTGPVRAAVSQLTSAGAELLAGTAQQAAGAQEQAAAVSQTVATVGEVTQTAEQAARRAQGLGEAVQRNLETGRAGRQVVEESIAALGRLRGQVEATAQTVLTLAEQAQAIGEIIAAVNDLAEQTNLLALNAAIEAARAGEAGRGFAVVAGEVRALAEQSRKATAQVRQILTEVQRATNGAVLSTEQVTKGVAAAAQVAGQAGETIGALADALDEAARAAAQIGASAGQQAAGMAQISQAMRNIDQVAKQNLVAMRQAEQAAQDLNGLGTSLAALVGP